MVNFKEDEQLSTLNHSCAHLMAQAIKHLYPQAKFWVGPVVAEGFYYDVERVCTVCFRPSKRRKRSTGGCNTISRFNCAAACAFLSENSISGANPQIFPEKMPEKMQKPPCQMPMQCGIIIGVTYGRSSFRKTLTSCGAGYERL